MKDSTCVLAVIGGSGIGTLAGFDERETQSMETPWGAPSARIHCGMLRGVQALFLARHGEPHAIAPHRINYRANIWALRELGATQVIAINAVGGIADHARPGELFLPHQIIDYSWGRSHSFHDGELLSLEHQEFAHPYDAALVDLLRVSAIDAGVAVHSRAVYGCTQGPRLETAAEIERLLRDGCDLVGMTGMPEAVLAAELGLRYASLAMVVNRAAGLSDQPISEAQIKQVAAGCVERVAAVLGACADRLSRQA
jgi:5'-methylthioinosine phosphorylase